MCLSTVLVCLSTVAEEAKQPSERPGSTAERSNVDEWYLIDLDGAPIGYIHRTIRARPGGGYQVIDSQKLFLRRNAARVKLEVSSSIEEDAAGRVVGFRLLETQPGTRLEASALVNESRDALLLTERTRGNPPRTRSIPLPADTVGPMRAVESMRRQLRRSGDSLELRVLQPRARASVLQKVVLGPSERIELINGTRTLLRRVDVSGTGRPSTRWVDADFHLYRSSTPLAGRLLVTRRSTRRRVMAEDFASPPEVFVASFVPARGRVPARSEAARYRLTSEGGVAALRAGHLLTAPGQALVRFDPSAVEVTVRHVRPSETSSLDAKQLLEHLRPNRFLQVDDPRLVGQARKIAAAERDPWRIANALARWVHGAISRKSLDTVFASALEVLAIRRGDCSEHAVLLAALCRARRIPSRLTAGLIFRDGVFAGHVWVEVFAGGWIPLDATLKDPTVYADHIALATSSLDGAGLTELLRGVTAVLGDIEIEVLAVEKSASRGRE